MQQQTSPLKIYKASAGSGKTFTLAVEYITRLVVNPMEYQNILAVTFTNKATAEMKQRILGTLYGIAHSLQDAEAYVDNILANAEQLKTLPAYQEEPYRSAVQQLNRTTLRTRAREALANIIHDYSRFHIETIDSFFQSIVREIASELELPTHMKVELDESDVLSEAVDALIDDLDEHSNEFRSIVEFIEEKIRTNRSWQVGETVKEFGRNIFKENYLIHGEDVRRRITDYSTIHRYQQLLTSQLQTFEQQVTEMGHRFFEAYQESGFTDQDISKRIVTFFEKVRDQKIKEPSSSSPGTFSNTIAEYMDDADKWFVGKSKRRDILRPTVNDVFIPLLSDTFDRYQTYLAHAHTTAAITQHLYSLMLLNRISQRIQSLNSESGRFLLAETANFLRNIIQGQDIPFIYEKTGAVIKHIMIDEFQDTSALQWQNFKPLILNSLAMDGSCLIVGDVKQSIYRFRNSDWRILNGIEQDPDLQTYITSIPAQYNFRSSRHVVEFNNELFSRATNLLQADCPALVTAYGDVCQKSKKDADVGFVLVENIDYHDINKDDVPDPWERNTPKNYDEANLQRLQLSVKELVDNGVNPNDITILTRTNREVPQISDYFNQHQDILQVKVVSDDAFRLDASPAINILIDALRTLAEPDSQLHLAVLTHHVGTIPTTFDETARAALRFKPLTELAEDLYQIFHLEQLPNQDAYLFYFHDLLDQFSEDNQTDIDSFLQAWDESLCEKTIPNGMADGVRIMTMHKSKGLEFHSVIIPACSWLIKPKDCEVMWCQPHESPYNLMPLLPISISKAKEDSIFADDRDAEYLKTLVDNINLLYVAFTRAKNNLVILTGNKLGQQADPAPNIDSAQSFLSQAMPEWMEKSDVEGCITRYQFGQIVPSQLPAPEKNKAASTATNHKEEESNVMEDAYAPLPVTFSSYPTVAEFRQSNESDLFFTASSDNPKTQQHAERIRLISLGNLYHHVFQHIHTLDDVPHAIRQLQARGCFGTLLEADQAQQTVTRLITDISTTHPEWFSPDWTVLNERAILYLDHNHLLSNRRPDRVIIRDSQAIVIDYKTAQGVLTRQADGTLTAPSENVQQVELYKNLLTQMGYTHVEAYLWFILDNAVVKV